MHQSSIIVGGYPLSPTSVISSSLNSYHRPTYSLLPTTLYNPSLKQNTGRGNLDRLSSLQEQSLRWKRDRMESSTYFSGSFAESSGMPDYTAAQVECATRLGVDLSECNTHGVFINRSPLFSDNILGQTGQTSWEDVTPQHLEKIVNIALINRDVSFVGELDFDGLTQLISLHLRHNVIADLPPNLIKGRGLSSLEIFDVAENKISSIDSLFFDDVPNLETLSISGNNISALSDLLFDHTPKLSRFHVYSNPLLFSESMFKTFLNRTDLQLFYFYDSLFRTSEDTVAVATGDSFVKFSDVVDLFVSGSVSGRSFYFYPSQLILPELGVRSFNLQERKFLCSFFQELILEKGYLMPAISQGSGSIETCEDRFFETVITPSQNDSFTTATTQEPAGSRMTEVLDDHDSEQLFPFFYSMMIALFIFMCCCCGNLTVLGLIVKFFSPYQNEEDNETHVNPEVNHDIVSNDIHFSLGENSEEDVV